MKRKKLVKTRRSRDVSTIANRRLRPVPIQPRSFVHADRRKKYPYRVSPLGLRTSGSVNVVAAPGRQTKSQRGSRSPRLGDLFFAAPNRVMVCVRRKERREVLMAQGRGGSRVRRPRRNRFSHIKC